MGGKIDLKRVSLHRLAMFVRVKLGGTETLFSKGQLTDIMLSPAIRSQTLSQLLPLITQIPNKSLRLMNRPDLVSYTSPTCSVL